MLVKVAGVGGGVGCWCGLLVWVVGVGVVVWVVGVDVCVGRWCGLLVWVVGVDIVCVRVV